MVAEKTSKLQDNEFLKVTDVRYLTSYANQRFKSKGQLWTTNAKSKKDNKRNTAVLRWEFGNFFLIAPFPDDCLLSHFYALVGVYNVCVTLILIDDVCF